MNGPNQVRYIYYILRESVGEKYSDSQLIEYASTLHDLFNNEPEEGYEFRASHYEHNTQDVYSLMSSFGEEMMHEERELLNLVYESDDFITNKPWSRYFGGNYEC